MNKKYEKQCLLCSNEFIADSRRKYCKICRYKETVRKQKKLRLLKHEKSININLTKETMYLLGFLWADGYFYKNTIRLGILKEDMQHIEKFFNNIGNFRFYNQNPKNRQPQTLAYISNQFLFNYLMSIGYDKRESLSKEITEHKYFNYWIRGLIDGDGCFYVNRLAYLRQFNICSNYKQNWQYFTNLLDKLEIKYKICRRIHKQSKSSIVRITNKNDILKFGNYLGYNDYDNIGLKRKYQKWLQTIS